MERRKMGEEGREGKGKEAEEGNSSSAPERKRKVSAYVFNRLQSYSTQLHNAFIGHARQRHDVIGCNEIGTVGAQSVCAPRSLPLECIG